MECLLCGQKKTHKHGKTSNVVNNIIVLNVHKLSPRLLTRSTLRRKIQPEQMRMVLQAHVEGSSLRGICGTVHLAYNKVVSLVRATSEKGQMIHNVHVQKINTSQITSDEFWSFVKKKHSSVPVSGVDRRGLLDWHDLSFQNVD